MKKLATTLLLVWCVFFFPAVSLAASNGEVEHFTQETLTSLIGLASLVVVFFLIRGGYQYMTSSGNPSALDEAKHTIRNALLGLVMVVGAGVLYSIFNTAFTQPASMGASTSLSLTPIQPGPEDSTLTKILLDAVSGFLKNLVTSAAKPMLDSITTFLTSTPSMATNSVVFNFWLTMVGITDSLFALVIALLGFQVMGASAFGFEEISLKELLPRIGLAFLVANTSIFLIDWLILLCQTLVHAVLSATGGIGAAWILNAFDPGALVSGSTLLITLVFMTIFLVLSAALLLFYISRLILLAFGAVMSPLVSLLWLIPKTADFAESAIKAYVVTIFTIFIHVVIIQLASAFLTVPSQIGNNPLISVFIGIAMFSVLLKSTALTVQLALASGATGAFKKFNGQLFNVLSPATSTVSAASAARKVGGPR